MQIRFWETPNAVHARIILPLRTGGDVSVQLTVTAKQVIQYLKSIGVRFDAKAQAEIGSLFGSIGKLVKKVAKSSLVKGVLKVAKGVANSPLVKMIAPAAAMAIGAANGAAKLMKAAKGGNPKAKLALKAAVAQADLETKTGQQHPVPSAVKAKGPEAAMAFRYMVTVSKVAA
jgi:hypothetical protein